MCRRGDCDMDDSIYATRKLITLRVHVVMDSAVLVSLKETEEVCAR